jgi:hypothetical protein
MIQCGSQATERNNKSTKHKQSMKGFIISTLAAITLVGAAFSARAAEPANTPAAAASETAPATATSSNDSLKPAMNEDEWQFGLGIPLWAPQINGNSTVHGNQRNVNVSYNTLRQHLDAVFSMAVEARKGKFDFYGDVGYMKFSFDDFAPGGQANAWTGLKFLVADAGMGYLIVKTDSEHPFLLEATAGVRYWYVSDEFTVTSPAGTAFLRGSKTWNVVDPVLGFRGSQFFTRKLHLDFAADGGGFGINHNTDWTWSATSVLTYDFVKWFSLSAGYKAVALDESENKTNGKNGVNLIFHGALVAAKFNF